MASRDGAGDLRGVRVVITGAASGLGAALAEAFCERGAVVAAHARRAQQLDALVARNDLQSGRIHPVAGDLAHRESARAAMCAAADALGGIDILINNAAVLGRRDSLATYDLDLFETAIAVNLTGALTCVQAVVPQMSDGGVIINVTSGAAARPTWGAYAVTKHALNGLTSMLDDELAPQGIRCITIDPGAMRTPMRAAAYPQEDPLTVPQPHASVAPFLDAAMTLLKR